MIIPILANTATKIDTFSFADNISAEYECVVVYQDGQTFNTQITVSCDGDEVTTDQTSLSSNVKPADVMTVLNEHAVDVFFPAYPPAGQLQVTSTVIPASTYGGHTTSGARIVGDQGFGISLGTRDTITIRSDDNEFVFANTYLETDQLGPVVETYAITNPIAFNGATVDTSSDIVVQPSNQNNSCAYYELDVEVGEQYSFSTIASAAFEPVLSKDYLNTNTETRIAIGTSIGSTDIAVYTLSGVEENCQAIFTATTEKIFVCLGIGRLGTTATFKEIIFGKYVPFKTYSQKQGTLIFEWSNDIVPNTLADIGENVINSDGANQILVNNTIVGTQTINNIAVISYSGTQAVAKLNGGSFVVVPWRPASSTCELDITTVTRLTYYPTITSNNDMQVITNG